MAVTKTGSETHSDIATSGPLTYAHTVASDADCLVVGVELKQNAGSVGTATVTYNGVSMVEAVSKLETNTFHRVYLFQLVAPATGTNNVVVTTSGSVSAIGSGAQGWKGVDQTTPVSNTASATGSSTTASVTVTSVVGEWTQDMVGAGQALSAPTQTVLWNPVGNVNQGASEATGAASVTFQWTLSSSDVWAHVALSLKAVTTSTNRTPILARFP